MMYRCRLCILSAFVLLLGACSDPRFALWYEMQERRNEYEYVTSVVQAEQASQSMVSDSIAILPENIITFIDVIEQKLLLSAELHGSYAKREYDVESPAYYGMGRATELLIGADPGSPRTDQYSGKELLQKLQAFKTDFARVAGLTQAQMDVHLFTEPAYLGADGVLIPWEVGRFYHMPMATVIERLEELKAGVRHVQYSALLKRRHTVELTGLLST